MLEIIIDIQIVAGSKNEQDSEKIVRIVGKNLTGRITTSIIDSDILSSFHRELLLQDVQDTLEGMAKTLYPYNQKA